jgi:hypothetical protein
MAQVLIPNGMSYELNGMSFSKAIEAIFISPYMYEWNGILLSIYYSVEMIAELISSLYMP